LAVIASSSTSAQEAWFATGSLTRGRFEHTATLLPSGQVLVVAGNAYSAEIYDPATGTWSAGGPFATQAGQTATLLASGKVLVAGGYVGDDSCGCTIGVKSADLYDPDTGTWTATGLLNTPRSSHTATLLPSGQVLVAGGYNPLSLESAELYDPQANTWTATVAMYEPRALHTATLLPSGKVLVAGGLDAYSGQFLAGAELYDPQARTWTATVAMYEPRAMHTATLLPTGTVLVAGGRSDPRGFLASAALFTE
jgi:N-acetylneuraminic acid mutarotase